MTGPLERAAPVGAKVCRCSAVHRPRIGDLLDRHHIWPVGWHGPDTPLNLVWVCPNLHRVTHAALDVIRRAGGPAGVAWLTRRRFPRYAWRLAVDGWTRWDAAGRP